MTTTAQTFPIDLSAYNPVAIDPFGQDKLSDEQRDALAANIRLCRDAIVFFTATGAAKGLGGHTGGPYDTVPEVMLLDAFFRGAPDRFVPVFFDEAGHRAATQYLMAAIHGKLDPERLAHYREAYSGLPGHPERGLAPGIEISSGRLGHMWPYVNGVAMANPDKVVFCLGSDGSQQEGNDAEAARLAVAKRLNVKLVVDDNDVTIAGHPSQYLEDFSIARTLGGHGLAVLECDGENLEALFGHLRQALTVDGPAAVLARRKMCIGIEGLEGNPKGHDVISVEAAVHYLTRRGRTEAVEHLEAIDKAKHDDDFRGAGERIGSNRNVFGEAVNEILDGMTDDQRRNVMVIDSDLEGSCGLATIRKQHPEVFVRGGVMERGNLSAAAGFGYTPDKQGVFATFSAFLEMCVSEITMARLNKSNLLCHFSHAGMDDMADNTCHFGLNNLFADNGLDDDEHPTRLYFPADAGQMTAVVKAVFHDPGLRFIFSTRSKTPNILTADGRDFYGEGYEFVPGRDEGIRDGRAGFVVAVGDALYRALDAVERLREEGIDVGLVNKPTLNVVDEQMMQKIGATGFVVTVESLSRRNGLGSRMGTWLIERGLTPKFARLGTHREGCGGLHEHFYHQGLDPKSIMAKVKELAG